MRNILLVAAMAGLFAVHGVARAQTAPSPRALQDMIETGQASAALGQLQGVLQAHPSSGVAWYLTAEAQDRLGQEDAARSALAKAEQLAPGLPFAKPAEVAALQTHLQGGGDAARAHGGVSKMVFVIGALVVLFLVVRVFVRARRRTGPVYDAYGRPMAYGPGAPGYAPPGYGQPGFGGGSGLGGSLIGGLAAGAGFAAGERIIEDFEGDREQSSFDPNNGGGVDPAPDRDDGLQGDPGWDDNSGGGGFDPNNSW